MQQGKLIVIDGLDGAGKTTQLERLVERLQRESIPVTHLKFPRYESLTGRTLKQYLQGKLGSPLTQSPYLVSLLFAVDRWAVRDELQKLLDAGQTVVLDRYVPSNLCFQAARTPANERQALRDWLTEIEYNLFKLPKLDSLIVLSIDTDLAAKLIQQRGGEPEAYERDRAFAKEVAKEYELYCQTDPNAHLIRCDRDNTLLTVEEIHERIWTVLEPLVTGGQHE